MKVLIICSINSGRVAPFITDQVEALVKQGIVVDWFTIEGKGWKGYLNNRKALLAKIKMFEPDIIHAHYGLSGLLANTQRKIPVVTTYHGSDINHPGVYPLSRICMMLSAFNIFVSQKNKKKCRIKRNNAVIPCGVDLQLFRPIAKAEAREFLGFKADEKLVLFSGDFNNRVKNPELAIKAVSELEDVKLVELKGYSREQVAMLMNAVDVCLMTSLTEGSPQFIKEAMACNCPVVSVDVGDVVEVLGTVSGCFVVDYQSDDIAKKIERVFNIDKRINGRERLIQLGLDAESVAIKIVNVYGKITIAKVT